MNRSLTQSQLPSMTGQAGQNTLPTNITTQYGFTPQNMPHVPCYYHESQIITYFCKESKMPLCQDCVQVHQRDQAAQGQRTNIVPLEACLTEGYNHISSLANEIVLEYHRLQEIQQGGFMQDFGEKTSLLTNPIQLIESARNQVHTIVDNYFNSLVTYIRARVPQVVPQKIDVTPLQQDLRSHWNKVIVDLEALNSIDCLKQLINVYKGDIQRESDHLLQTTQQVIHDIGVQQSYIPHGLDVPQLHIDPLFLQKFLWALERYAYFFEPPFEHPVEMLPIVHPQIPITNYPMYSNLFEKKLNPRQGIQTQYPDYDQDYLHESYDNQIVTSAKKSKKSKRNKQPRVHVHHVQNPQQQVLTNTQPLNNYYQQPQGYNPGGRYGPDPYQTNPGIQNYQR